MRKILLSALVLFSTWGLDVGAQTLAFPGAEGFGKYASGGRGGKVYTVTNLNDDGPGSFRQAFNAYPGEPLTIVFGVSGTIDLLSEIKVKRGDLTIAGQTAPGDGICFRGESLTFNGADLAGNKNNIIIRYLRSRPGATLASGVYGLDLENVENVIIDHCSFSWANEEDAAMYDMKNVTVQYSIISEGLFNAGHLKGTRGYGGVWGGQYSSYHHNLFAHLNARSTRFNGARAHDKEALIDYRNNVVYNAGSWNAAAGGAVNLEDAFSRINLVNNYYKPGPATPTNYVFIQGDYEPEEAKGVGEFYVNGNVMHGKPDQTSDNWLAVDINKIPEEYREQAKSTTPFDVTVPIPVQSAEEAYIDVLLNAGANLPVRDAVDKRIVSETATGTASVIGPTSGRWGIIDLPSDVGGWPNYPQLTAPADTDGDGMPDSYEDTNGLDKNDPTDGNTLNSEGYSNLELYLNSITSSSTAQNQPIGFAATLQTGAVTTVDVNWTFIGDQGISQIEVERSQDGLTYSSLASLESHQNTSLSEYTFTDAAVPADQSYYRLKITATDNQISYSEVKEVNNPVADAYFSEPFDNVPVTSFSEPPVPVTYTNENGEWIIYGARKITGNVTDVDPENQWTDGNANPRLEWINQTKATGYTESPYVITPVFDKGISKLTFFELTRPDMRSGSISVYTSTDGGQTWSADSITSASKVSKFDLITVDIANGEAVNRLKITKPAGVGMSIDDLTVYAPLGISLPVNLVDFKAHLRSSIPATVNIYWTTADEKNIATYELQRSSDGRNFKTIHISKAANTTGTHNYSYVDEHPAIGSNYYRLKVVDKDGKIAYSHLSGVKVLQNQDQVVAYPNPASSYIHFNVESAIDQLRILDMSGRVASVQQKLKKGAKVNIANLSPGIYFAELTQGGVKTVVRFVKK